MKCCANCIGDSYLRDEVFEPNGVVGNCDYCGSPKTRLIDPSDLVDRFEILLGCYSKDDNGQRLVELLQEDWAMFVDSGMSGEMVEKLLTDILMGNSAADARYVRAEALDSTSVGKWDDFKNEVRHENRFFPENAPDPSRLKELLDYLVCGKSEPHINGEKPWYRSRIQKNRTGYSISEMGAPPCDLATHGRANPAGIPYLYLASSIDTAIAEVRPHAGEVANVAVFVINDIGSIKIADLRHPRKTVSPFKIDDEAMIIMLRQDLVFLEELGNELTHPVIPDAAAIDYTPSQYLCEFMKQRNFDGVMYKSSVGDDVNLALFDVKRAVAHGVVERYMVTKVGIDIEKL